MDEPLFQQRLSQIETAWTLIQQAHGDTADPDTLARLVDLVHEEGRCGE